jgi:hypothetical protein
MRVAASRRKCALVLSISAICFGGCNVTPEALVGVYNAEYGSESERLVLRRDGAFEQTVRRSNSGEICKTNGTWHLGEGGQVEFTSMILTWRTPARTGCPLPKTAVLPSGRFVVTVIEVPDHFYYWKGK